MTNETTPFFIWRDEVLGAAGVAWHELEAIDGRRRLGIWYAAGETIQGAAEMLRIFVNGAEKAKRLTKGPTVRSLTEVGCTFREEEL